MMTTDNNMLYYNALERAPTYTFSPPHSNPLPHTNVVKYILRCDWLEIVSIET